jgi:hypothetical protein
LWKAMDVRFFEVFVCSTKFLTDSARSRSRPDHGPRGGGAAAAAISQKSFSARR